MRYTDIHGNRNVVIRSYGTLETDFTGLSTATAEFSAPADRWQILPKILTPHPVWKFLGMSHSSVTIEEAFAIMRADYKGVFDDPNGNGGDTGGFSTPVYELTVGLTEEPIETHPKFADKIAGTPSNPLNGSLWKHLTTGRVASASNKATSDTGYIFAGWELTVDGNVSDFYGIDRYLDVGTITWRERKHGRRGSSIVNQAGTVQNPRGPAPNLPGDRNWMNMGTTMTEEGFASSFLTEWRASSLGGWNTTIYNGR
jgi:hypothetical protein